MIHVIVFFLLFMQALSIIICVLAWKHHEGKK